MFFSIPVEFEEEEFPSISSNCDQSNSFLADFLGACCSAISSSMLFWRVCSTIFGFSTVFDGACFVCFGVLFAGSDFLGSVFFVSVFFGSAFLGSDFLEAGFDSVFFTSCLA